MKMSSAAAQSEIGKLVDQFSNIVDEVKAFKAEVFERCQEYVDHATKMEETFNVLDQQEEMNVNKIQNLKVEVQEAIEHQEEIMGAYAHNMKNYYDSTSGMILEYNAHHTKNEELESDVRDLRMWQEEVNNSHRNIKTEESDDVKEPEEEVEDEQAESTKQPEE